MEALNKKTVNIDLNYLYYRAIFLDDSEFRIWKKLDNGCSIATMGYSKENVLVLMKLLESFAEQYGEEITYESASDELKLYQDNGKLFIYLDENNNPVSMNGVTYNEDNISVGFGSSDDRDISSLYFYGLSTVHEYRGKGACRTLIDFAIQYAYYNNFDLVYARTDLINSNSEWIMQNAGLEVCKNDNDIIAEWVPVTESKGDYRLHMWLPLKEDVYIYPKEDAIMADGITREIKVKKDKVKKKDFVYEEI